MCEAEDSDEGNRLVGRGWQGEEETNWKSGIDIYTLAA